MWPDFYELGTTGLGRTPPVPHGSGTYVLIETMGPNPDADPQHFEAVIGAALEAGVVEDAVIAQSTQQTTDLWTMRDSPGGWRKAGHTPQLSFDVSVSTGEIGALVDEPREALATRWPGLAARYFGHVADGNLHVSVRLTADPQPPHAIEAVVYETIARRRGCVSAEHGIGSLKREFLPLLCSPAEIALTQAAKRAVDPKGILNPGKIF